MALSIAAVRFISRTVTIGITFLALTRISALSIEAAFSSVEIQFAEILAALTRFLWVILLFAFFIPTLVIATIGASPRISAVSMCKAGRIDFTNCRF